MEDDIVLQRITSNPLVLGGKPIIRGTRILVALINDWVAAGQTPAEIIADYPVLTEEDIAAALAHAKRERERTEIRAWSPA